MILPRFRILRPLARSNLGALYVAYDEELRREVAFKQIHPRYIDHHEYRVRFIREALATASLEHPGIVPVYSFGQDADGQLFYAMKLIQGITLKVGISRLHHSGSHKNARDLELRSLMRSFAAACLALDYAHCRGVLHRDIKPSNIMLGAHGETIVIDWGMAKLLGVAYDEFSALTMPGTPMGTPNVIPPEQASGDLERLGPVTDIAGLGATLYYILVGRAPFDGRNRIEVLEKASCGQFPRPRHINPDVPLALEAVCLKAMALRPEDRYPSAQALGKDIERWLAGEAVSVHQATSVLSLDLWQGWWRSWRSAISHPSMIDSDKTRSR